MNGNDDEWMTAKYFGLSSCGGLVFSIVPPVVCYVIVPLFLLFDYMHGVSSQTNFLVDG